MADQECFKRVSKVFSRRTVVSGASHRKIMAEKAPLHWRRENIMELIDICKDNVCLWQVRHRLYKDRNARDAAMRKILD